MKAEPWEWGGIVIGLLLVVLGTRAYIGRGARLSASLTSGRPAIGLSVGAAFVLLCLGSMFLAGSGKSVGSLLIAAGLILCAFGGWVGLVGAPKWATPRWQKEGSNER